MVLHRSPEEWAANPRTVRIQWVPIVWIMCGCREHRTAECSVKGLDRIKMEAVEQCRLWGIDGPAGGKQRMLRVIQTAVDMVKGTRNEERERSYEQQARRAQSAKKAAGAAWAKVEALRRGEYRTPRSRVEAAKAQAAVKEAEAQWRAASAQREKARDRQRCHREREVTARGWKEQRKAKEAQGFALEARATAESAMKAAECARERADKKRAEAAKAADAERKRAVRESNCGGHETQVEQGGRCGTGDAADAVTVSGKSSESDG